MNRNLFLLLLAFIGLSFNGMAQSSITGKIVDEKSGKGIPFVNIGLFRTVDSVFVCGAASDDKGAFTLQGAPNGEMQLRVSAIGYANFEQILEVKGNQDLGTIKLHEGSMTLDEVTVVEKRPLFAVEGEKTYYNTAEDPSIQTGTASDALQNAPGVTVDVEGNITLRGTSSVEIWINDKPSHMSEENLKTYIQTMPANTIDHVEVITNPSARYGSKADGIINIVTNAKIQRNEFVSFGVNASTKPFVAPWVSYVYSNDKLTLNAYISGNYHVQNSSFRHDQTLFDANHVAVNHEYDSTDQRSKTLTGITFLSFDYEFDTANSLNVWLNACPNMQTQDYFSRITRQQFLDDDGNPLPTPGLTDYTTPYNTKDHGFWGMGGLYFQHRFDNKGHNLSVSANTMGWTYNSYRNMAKRYVLPYEYNRVIDCTYDLKNLGGEGEIIYNRPYSENGEISVGWTTEYSPSSWDVIYDTLVDAESNLYEPDLYRTYQSNYFNLTNEAFVTLQQKWGGFTMKPGLRLCDTWVKGNAHSGIDTCDFSKHFFSLRPTLHLSYRTKSMHNFSASYTRRISSPDADQLTPFLVFNEDEFESGNPNLNPIYTNAFELGWTKYFEKFGSLGLSAYYRDHKNEISMIQLSTFHPLFGRVVPYSYPVNVGYSSTKGVNLNMMYRPSGFFNIRLDADVYDSYWNTDFEGQYYSDYSWAYSFRANLWAKLWNRLEVTAMGYYASPTNQLFSSEHAHYGLNCGMRADFFDRKMSVFVNAQDILNSSSWGMDNNSPYVESTSVSKFQMRAVVVGLTFRFGKMELENVAKQGADTGSQQGGSMGM